MDDSPWDDDPNYNSVREIEWSKISNDFTNAGYREGITAGKESAVQEGFDKGFAEIGVPLGRQVGHTRGMAAALVGIFSTPHGSGSTNANMNESVRAKRREVARNLLDQLNNVRFSDIAPPDLQAEEHAREHGLPEGIDEKRQVEELEDKLGGLGRGGKTARPTREGVAEMVREVEELANEIK